MQVLSKCTCSCSSTQHVACCSQHTLQLIFHSFIFFFIHSANQDLGSAARQACHPCCYAHRCYEVRCQNGLVIANYTGAASNPTSAAELQTISQGYVPTENLSAVTDTFGRTAPANPLLSKNLIYTNCWNNTLVRAGCPSRCIIMWQLLCQLPSASPAASAEPLQ